MNRRLRGLILPTVFLMVTAYFVFNALAGSRGMRAQAQDRQALAKAQSQLVAVNLRRARWQARVNGLANAAIRPDLLDQEARAVLNLARADDLVVPLPPQGTADPSGKTSAPAPHAAPLPARGASTP